MIDGHHTAFACKLLGGRQIVTAIYGSAQQILNKIIHFPGVYRLGFH